jgi:hypothetical protein
VEREAAKPYHSVVVFLDHADEEARIVVVEELAIDHKDVVAVPDCGHVVPPLSPAGRVGRTPRQTYSHH